MRSTTTIVTTTILALLPLSAHGAKEGVSSLVEWGRYQRDEGRDQIAEIGFGAAIERSPTWVLPYVEKAELAIARNEGYAEVRSEILALGPDRVENPRLHRVLGQLAVLEGNDAAAERAFSRSLDLRPEQVQARAERAAVLGRLGRHAEAATEYGRAVEASPNDNALRSRYADALEAAQRHKEARAQLELLIKRQPDKEAPLRQLARFLERRGDRKGAAAAAAKADRLRPGGDRVMRPLPASKR